MGIVNPVEEAGPDITDAVNELSATMRKFFILMRAVEVSKNQYAVPKIAVTVPYTATLQAPFTVYDSSVAGTYGALLRSLSIAVDSVFQANYYWKVVVDGNIPPSTPFQPFDPTLNVFDEIGYQPWPIPPGGGVHIYAYNATGTTSNGIMSVYIDASQLTQEEYNVIFGSSQG